MEELGIYGKSHITKSVEQNGLSLKKRWGQNFLLDRNISNKIVQLAMGLLSEDERQNTHRVWEIGPGLGALTQPLLQSVPTAHLELFEIDFGLIRFLTNYFKDRELGRRVQIHAGNAELRLHEILNQIIESQEFFRIPNLIIGNLPYSNGVRILISASKIQTRINDVLHDKVRIPMCVMLQKESVERIMAPSSTKLYGLSSVLLQLVYDVKISMEVPAHLFYPAPHVSSVVCNLVPKSSSINISLAEYEMLRTIVHHAFLQRRKTLRNTLNTFLQGLGIEDRETLCEEAGISLASRAENIEPNQYLMLSKRILEPRNH